MKKLVFSKPPINEVMLGVVFNKLDSFTVPYFGLLWKEYEKELPIVQQVRPIIDKKDATLEDITKTQRIWFIRSDYDNLLQVQQDRIFSNWRRITGNPYPLYSELRKGFKKHYSQFQSFIKKNKLGQIKPVKYQLAYINHIARDEQSLSCSLLEYFPNIFAKEAALQNISNINWRLNYEKIDNIGSLEIVIKPQKKDNKDILLFELNVIGDAGVGVSMWKWYDSAHSYIRKTFLSLTSEKIQKKIWGKI